MERMIEEGSGRSWVAIEWELMGQDLSVAIIGGEKPHIGACALAFQRDGSIEVRSLAVPGHKESELACFCAESLAQATGRTVLVHCGIHIDHATQQEIQTLCGYAKMLTGKLLDILSKKLEFIP